MEKNITATVNLNSVKIKVWDNDAKQMYATEVTFFGNYDEKRKAEIRNDYSKSGKMVCKFYDDTLELIASEKYAMPETQFYTLAEVMEKRPNGNYISRTATATKCDVLLYNTYTDDTEVKHHIVSGKNTANTVKTISKIYKKSDYLILNVVETETITALYVLDSLTFFKNATLIH